MDVRVGHLRIAVSELVVVGIRMGVFVSRWVQWWQIMTVGCTGSGGGTSAWCEKIGECRDGFYLLIRSEHDEVWTEDDARLLELVVVDLHGAVVRHAECNHPGCIGERHKGYSSNDDGDVSEN